MDSDRLIVDVLAGLGVLANALVVLPRYSTLPDRVPIHFDLRGRADNWGPRWTLVAFLVMSAGIQVLMGWIGRSDAQSDALRATSESAARQARLGVLLIDVLRVEFAWLFASLGWKTVDVARGKSPGIGWPIMVAILAVGVLTPVVWVVLAFLAS